jgi:hypothetical protein
MLIQDEKSCVSYYPTTESDITPWTEPDPVGEAWKKYDAECLRNPMNGSLQKHKEAAFRAGWSAHEGSGR